MGRCRTGYYFKVGNMELKYLDYFFREVFRNLLSSLGL